MYRILVVLFATLSAFGQQATAQSKLTEGVRLLRAYYGDKPLAIGTPVWANIGDNLCGYPRTYGRYNWPDIGRHCFQPSPDPKYHGQTWYRARIASYTSTFWTGRGIDLYVVEFLPPPKDGKDHKGEGWFVSRGPDPEFRLTRNAVIEGEAFKMINVFDERAEWSVYVITLNW